MSNPINDTAKRQSQSTAVVANPTNWVSQFQGQKQETFHEYYLKAIVNPVISQNPYLATSEERDFVSQEIKQDLELDFPLALVQEKFSTQKAFECSLESYTRKVCRIAKGEIRTGVLEERLQIEKERALGREAVLAGELEEMRNKTEDDLERMKGRAHQVDAYTQGQMEELWEEIRQLKAENVELRKRLLDDDSDDEN